VVILYRTTPNVEKNRRKGRWIRGSLRKKLPADFRRQEANYLLDLWRQKRDEKTTDESQGGKRKGDSVRSRSRRS